MMVVSQDFGGNKYSKNIRVAIQILQLCRKTLEGISTAKYQIDNTNKIIVSQGFGRNKYCKNIVIIYVINDRF